MGNARHCVCLVCRTSDSPQNLFTTFDRTPVGAQPPGDTSKGGAGRESVDLGPWASVERRDTWDVIWATDDPNQVRRSAECVSLRQRVSTGGRRVCFGSRSLSYIIPSTTVRLDFSWQKVSQREPAVRCPSLAPATAFTLSLCGWINAPTAGGDGEDKDGDLQQRGGRGAGLVHTPPLPVRRAGGPNGRAGRHHVGSRGSR